MTRYFFNIKDGKDLPDHDGTELLDLDTAKAEAVKLSGAVLRDGGAGALWSGHPWQLRVTDGPSGTGLVLFTLHFSATDGA
jgi:hypothetical protein